MSHTSPQNEQRKVTKNRQIWSSLSKMFCVEGSLGTERIWISPVNLSVNIKEPHFMARWERVNWALVWKCEHLIPILPLHYTSFPSNASLEQTVVLSCQSCDGTAPSHLPELLSPPHHQQKTHSSTVTPSAQNQTPCHERIWHFISGYQTLWIILQNTFKFLHLIKLFFVLT